MTTAVIVRVQQVRAWLSMWWWLAVEAVLPRAVARRWGPAAPIRREYLRLLRAARRTRRAQRHADRQRTAMILRTVAGIDPQRLARQVLDAHPAGHAAAGVTVSMLLLATTTLDQARHAARPMLWRLPHGGWVTAAAIAGTAVAPQAGAAPLTVVGAAVSVVWAVTALHAVHAWRRRQAGPSGDLARALAAAAHTVGAPALARPRTAAAVPAGWRARRAARAVRLADDGLDLLRAALGTVPRLDLPAPAGTPHGTETGDAT